ncbi:fungal-specific transcription factor domain-containing protein [Flagelloscypha sp. PMI_526]|nr:fungal-specific transcription factor domain-containing protein [Flagelloscypha sp. PMI_526]
MARNDATTPTLASSSKKVKRAPDDDQSFTPDNSKGPIQLQRRRVWRACEACRRKKIKCDGVEPNCAQCTASGSQCTWLQTKDRAALSRHYVQELEARLVHMEGLFNELAPVLEQAAGPTSPTTQTGQRQLTTEEITKATNILRSLHNKHLKLPATPPISSKTPESEGFDDVSESFGQLALDEYGHMRWIGGSSTMSLIQSFKALTSSSNNRYSPMEEDPHAPGPSVNKIYFPASVFFGKTTALPGPEEVEYPDRDLADKLVETYFSRLHYLMPVIDKPSFAHQYRHLMDNTHDFNLARSETAFIALVFAVFACAASLVDDPRLKTGTSDDGGMGMVYYERALILQYISHARIQPAHVQCFILLSSFLCSVNCLPQAWILVGQAVRTGQDVGLHRSPRRLQIPPLEKELRRKIWWGVYTLDRMLAVALGRPLGINDADCDVEYPVEVDDDDLANYFTGNTLNQPRPLMSGFVLLIKLYQIAGRILRDVYDLELCKDNLESEQKIALSTAVQALDEELTQWCDALPPHFKTNQTNDAEVSISSVLCSHYYSVLTTLHRNLLPLKEGDQPIAPKSTLKAVSSARSCIRLASSIKDVVPISHHVAFFLQHLFSSAVILLLYSMHTPNPQTSFAALDEGKTALDALESWEGTWPGARNYQRRQEKAIEKKRMETGISAEGILPQGGLVGPDPLEQPQTASPAMIEGNRKVTIAVQSRPGRRGQSKDGSGRRMSAVSPYRDDGRRARSASRRRQDTTPGSDVHTPQRSHFGFTISPVGSAHGSPEPFPHPSPPHVAAPNSPILPATHSLLHTPYTIDPYTSGPATNTWGNNAVHSRSNSNPIVDDTQYNEIYGASGGFGTQNQFSGIRFHPELNNQEHATTFGGGSGLAGLSGVSTSSVDPSDGSSGPLGSVGEGWELLWNNPSFDPGAFEQTPDVPFNLGIDHNSGGNGGVFGISGEQQQQRRDA